MKIEIYPNFGEPINTSDKYITSTTELMQVVDAAALCFYVNGNEGVKAVSVNEHVIYVGCGTFKQELKELYISQIGKKEN